MPRESEDNSIPAEGNPFESMIRSWRELNDSSVVTNWRLHHVGMHGDSGPVSSNADEESSVGPRSRFEVTPPRIELYPEPQLIWCARCEHTHIAGQHMIIYCYTCDHNHPNGEHFQRCLNCGERHSETDCQGPYCSNCGSRHMGPRCRYCEECDTSHADGESCCTCGDCFECENQERYRRQAREHRERMMRFNSDYDLSRAIHSYGFQPDLRFLGDGPLYLGVELELEVRNGRRYSTAEKVQEVIGDMGYLKEDGSIQDGFELVTHPMSFAWMEAEFPWGELMETLQEGAAYDTRGTGIHVHVSRAGFDSPAHTLRWTRLLYRNQAKVERLARRRSGQWANFDGQHRSLSKYLSKGWPSNHHLSRREAVELRNLLNSRHGTNYPDLSRYAAINMNTPHGTHEVRVFRSTTKEQQARATVGLVHASVEYARQLDAHKVCAEKGWDWKTFATWVKDNDQYATLRKEMEVRRCVS